MSTYGSWLRLPDGIGWDKKWCPAGEADHLEAEIGDCDVEA